jgi:hypothetical protein
MRNDRAASAMGGKQKPKPKSKSKSKPKSKKGGKHVHEMGIRHAANGGYIVKHSFKPSPGGAPQEPEENQVPDMDALTQHVQDNMQPMAQPAPQPQPQDVRGGM